MTPEQFTYWLQGFMEISNPTTLDETQIQIIKDHLALVFDKQTPDRISIPPLAPMPTTPYPIWQEPYTIPFNPVCETPTYTETDPMKVKFCSNNETVRVPPHFHSESTKKKHKGGLKC